MLAAAMPTRALHTAVNADAVMDVVVVVLV
jgi:hypothetical protein